MATPLVWFGTRAYMQWVKAPVVGYSAPKSGFATSSEYLNGGSFVQRSVAGAKRYNLSWNMARRDEVRPVQDYADGIYGQGLVYYTDPFAMDKNMLPSYIAAPFQAAYDAPGFGFLDGSQPSLIATPANTLGYPSESAVYTFTGVTDKPEYYIPIPPGYTAWVGVNGSNATGSAAIAVRAYTPAGGIASTTNATLLSVSSTTRFNMSYNGSTTAGISLIQAGTGTITLSGIMVQLLPTGNAATTGNFISGQGNSGLAFANQPALEQQNAALDRVGLSVDLREVGAWL